VALRAALNLMLNSPESLYLLSVLGPRLPRALEQPVRTLRADAWDMVGPFVDKALAGGTSRFEDMPVTMARHGVRRKPGGPSRRCTTMRGVGRRAVEELGYAAIEAADAAAGLRVLGSGRRIDLLGTSIGLPGGMNGQQMADAARIARRS
jgi:hypothetical protein